MAIILNIESSGPTCSVALTGDGELLLQQIDDNGMNHAKVMAPFIEKALSELKRRELKLDAVAVSIGPGSYTGLRIGLSMAKGLCFGDEIPLIGIPTLQILAVKAMFRSMDWEGDEILLPMLDARRMEVYTAAFDFGLNEVLSTRPLILEKDSFEELNGKRVIVMGSGSEKAKEFYGDKDWTWLEGIRPLASDMTALSERAYRNGDFLDLAYSTPLYLKEYEAKVSKNKVLDSE